MAMGKVKVERRQRLYDLCKRIVSDPHDVDGDTGAALKAATLKYAATQYVDTEQALKNLYQEESELGSLLRKAVAVVADHDEDDSGGSASDHHASKVADLLVEAGTFHTGARRSTTFSTNRQVRRSWHACTRRPQQQRTPP